MLLKRKVRTGAVTVESACVYPVLFLLLLGIMLLGISVFRYQQVAHIAREAARWASVHGGQYAKENATPAATAQAVYENAIAPQAAGMKLTDLSYSVTWGTDATGNPLTSPTSTVLVTDPVSGQSGYVAVSNTVTVTVTYSWNTGLFGVIPVSSTSVNTISY
jgi:Flp pilus assembly protein TadG